jgi:hypothetical protein
MVLHRLEDYYANYTGPFGGSTIKAIKVYASNHEKVGTVRNLLIDGETGRFRYLILETGIWHVGRRVLLPVGLVQLDYEKQAFYTPQLTKQQIESLPDLAGELGTGASYEERISRVYGSLLATTSFSGMTHSSIDTESYNRNSDIYTATGSLHDYENELISQHRDECRT